MKNILFLLMVIILVGCKSETENPFNIKQESLSSKAEAKASNWNGYNDFVFELKTLTENFSKDYTVKKAGNLVSKSQAILYSMPSELRNEITNEKASELVQATKNLNDAISKKSEEDIKIGLIKIVSAYTSLNKEINYYTEN